MLDYDLEQAFEELLYEYSLDNIGRILEIAGVVDNQKYGEKISFRRLVFLNNDDEIYSKKERSLIDSIKDLIVFPEFDLNYLKGSIRCRCVCVDVSHLEDGIYSAVLFMKIIIKALLGFTLFLIKTDEGFHFGMRVFEAEEWNNCVLCKTNRFIDVLSDFWSVKTELGFSHYYKNLYDLIVEYDDSYKDYDDAALKRRGINYEYLNLLNDIEKFYEIPMHYEVERYYEWYLKHDYKYSLCLKLRDNNYLLRDVKTSRVNTLEMLFEAEELENNSIASNETIGSISVSDNSESNSMIDNSIIEMAEDDPELMMKFLKKKKGY